MKTYVVFDRKTGEIVQTHVRTDRNYGRDEDLLRTAKPEGHQNLDILAVDEIVPGTGYKVDTKARKLVPADANKLRGTGGAVVQHSGGISRTAETRFFNTRQKRTD